MWRGRRRLVGLGPGRALHRPCKAHLLVISRADAVDDEIPDEKMCELPTRKGGTEGTQGHSRNQGWRGNPGKKVHFTCSMGVSCETAK